jgi:hypothetical protein
LTLLSFSFHRDFGTTSSASSNSKDTPLSPPLHTESDTTISKNEAGSSDVSELNQLLDKIVTAILTTLRELMLEPGCDTRELIVEWCIELLATLPAKYNSPSMFVGLNPNACLTKQITFWTECKALKTLLDLVIDSVKALPNSKEHTQLVMHNLLRFSPNSNWICAYLLTALPEDDTHLLKACIDAFLENSVQHATASASGTAIFSFVSEKSPKAIINSLKHNIPVLLKLSFTSKPLLELLAIEAVKEGN